MVAMKSSLPEITIENYLLQSIQTENMRKYVQFLPLKLTQSSEQSNLGP